MANELVKASAVSVPAIDGGQSLPVLVEHVGSAARFAWDEFFYAEHHNPHTQKAYMAAVRRFLSWCEGQGVELPGVTPGMVGQYLVSLSGPAAKRNLHLSALWGFFDRLVNRDVVILNPAASVRGVKEQVIEGKTPEITVFVTAHRKARWLLPKGCRHCRFGAIASIARPARGVRRCPDSRCRSERTRGGQLALLPGNRIL
jgi:hypothetical protein